MQLYNTLTRTKEEFIPLEPGAVKMYCCGPTVYNFAHIGNLRTYVFEDILRRTIKFNGLSITHVMNITDVGHLESDADDGEDKMEKGAEREGLSVWEIARKYEDAFLSDTSLLNIERPEIICRATEHIPEMIGMIEKIAEHGAAYVTPDAVYFDTSRFPHYADFARLDLSGLLEGAGGRAQKQEEKRHPYDFVLWFSNRPKHIMKWESPWGVGYPGWHIECSAMSVKYLGDTFDIHCGGVDHINVHHTNEIAQSECATGKPFVRYWMHGEFLLTKTDNDEYGKESKSKGEFLTIKSLTDRGYNPLAYRYLCLQAHYRSELKFSWDTLEAAQRGLKKVYSASPDSDPLTDDDAFNKARTEALDALNDDLGTPQLVAILNRYNSYRLWVEFDLVLGLDIENRSKREEEALPSEVISLTAERDEARRLKDWARSDEIRNQLIAMGYEVGDTPEGTTVKRRSV
jgi:cysteinyl-tRNA synthetase